MVGAYGKSRTRAWLWLLLLALALGACTSPPESPLRIGVNLWLGYEPLFLARTQGLYPREAVKLVELPSTTDVLHALQAGTLEGAALTLDEVINLRREGVDLTVVLVMDFSAGGDALVARAGIESLTDLRGKQVGYENSAVGALMLDSALRSADLSPSDLTLVPLTPDEHGRAFAEGRVDAITTYEPTLSRLLASGGHVLFDSRAIPNSIVDVLAMRTSVLQSHPHTVRTLVEGWFKALDRYRQEPQTALPQMAVRHQMDVESLAKALRGLHFNNRSENRELLTGGQPKLLSTAQHLSALMVQGGLLSAAPNLNHLVSDRYLPNP